MSEKKMIFVILNYMNEEDTVECIESILTNMDTDSFHIILVDNFSPDDSGKKLFSRYENNGFVTVLLNEENKGNSEGLNYGIRYAKKNYDFEFLALPNNDVIFLETDFYQKVKNDFDETRFAVMGPMILTPTGRCDANPIFDLPYTRKAAISDMKNYKKKKRLLKLGIYRPYLKIHSVIKRIFPILYRRPSRKNRHPGSFLEKQENIVLHGCFLILSKIFFEHFEQLDVRSFMYAEEDILYMNMVHKGLKTLYDPKIIAYHKGDGSTKRAHKNAKTVEIFRCDKSIEAINGYLKLLDELGIE